VISVFRFEQTAIPTFQNRAGQYDEQAKRFERIFIDKIVVRTRCLRGGAANRLPK